jgi:hypothetical protein
MISNTDSILLIYSTEYIRVKAYKGRQEPTTGLSAEEVHLNWNYWIRQIHRWLSIAFTVTVVANFVALARGGGMPPPWITYSPLPPLALLLFTGLYMFVLPYAAKWRSERRTG